MGVEREQRYTRDRPCPICGGNAHDHPHCHGFLSEGGVFARCSNEDGGGRAMRTDKGIAPTYIYRREDNGTYRPWTAEPPPGPVRVSTSPVMRRTVASDATPKHDAKTHERHEGIRYFDYSSTQRVYRRNYRLNGQWHKDVFPEHKDDTGRWVRGDGPGPLHLIYRPAHDWHTDPVLIVEGETAAERARECSAGYCVVTWRGGTGRVAQAVPQLVEAFAGRRVTVWPDADVPGRRAMAQIAAALTEAGSRVAWFDPYADDSKRDAEDWVSEYGEHGTNLVIELGTAPEYAPHEYGTGTEERETGDSGGGAAPEAASTGVWAAKITRLSDVQPERVAWLWHLRLALGKLAVIDGDPGDGKSTLTTDLAARVSTGREMPDGTPGLGSPAGVVLLSAEDGLADTIRPRLDAAGGDPRRVVALECATDGDRERGVTLTDLPMIEQAIAAVDARLVIVDPLMAYLSAETNSYRDQDVRGILAPLARLAEKTGVAIVVVRHFSKAVGGKVLHKGGGSVGIVGAVRTALMVARDPDNPEGPRRILAQQKSNIGVFGASLAFHMEEHANGAARIVWDGATTHTAAELVAAPPDGEERSALDEAGDVLRQILKAGRIDAKTVYQEAKAAGVSERTLNRAKKTLNVVTTRNGFGPQAVWFWELPPEGENHRMPSDAIGCHTKSDGNLCGDVAIYDSLQREALPQGGENDDITIDCQAQYKEATPGDVAWAKEHIQSGALSFVAADMARIRRLCGGSFDTRTWRADLCERHGWPAPPPLALPPPPTPAPPDDLDTTALAGWLDLVRDEGLDLLPQGVRAAATRCGIPPGADEPPGAFAERLAAWLHTHREAA